MFKGIAVSPGVVVGVVYRVDSVFAPGERQTLADPTLVAGEIDRFDKAVAATSAELETFIHKIAQQLGQAEAEIFKSHLQIVNDLALLERVHDLIRSQHLTAISALQTVMQGYAATFSQIQQDHFRDRLGDIRDVISKIGGHLTVQPNLGPGTMATGDFDHQDQPVILVAHEILPSQAISLGNLPIAGIVTETGGSTSHAAILARSRGIPAVSGVIGITAHVASGDPMIVDGREGVVLIRPDSETTSAYRKMQREFFNLKDRLILNKDLPSISSDGAQVELLANINNVADAQSAVKVGATGVGLLRTEYLFAFAQRYRIVRVPNSSELTSIASRQSHLAWVRQLPPAVG